MRNESKAEEIKFTEQELAWLKREAEKKRAVLKAVDLHPKRVYEEERYEFISEYMRGALGKLTMAQRFWAQRIKHEMRVVRQKGSKILGKSERGAGVPDVR